ncbi:MAG: alpha/beta hydrolase [Firmicutes bacterium]|nr:alpha/beta hydrolase [Bacillota bacterium]
MQEFIEKYGHKTRFKPETPEMGVKVDWGSYKGHIRFFENFYSHHLNNNRNIWVYLPPSYDTWTMKNYPVLYLQDGQNVFAGETAFGGVEWGVDDTVESLLRQGKIKEIIMVAVSNTTDRESEYTHVPDPEYGGGNLPTYAKFLIEELKPFIDSNFRTKMGPEHTGIMGSSLGGLSAFWLGWTFPEVFGIVAALSPSFWWADQHLTKEVRIDNSDSGPLKIWIDIGSAEGCSDYDNTKVSTAVEQAREMSFALMDRGYVFGRDFFYFEATGASHNEWYWNRRVAMVLMALFGLPRV